MTEYSQTFEASMLRLEQIVRNLEAGNVPLEESLKLFQEGTDLVRRCGTLLENAKMQINMVMTGPDGSPMLEEFSDGQ